MEMTILYLFCTGEEQQGHGCLLSLNAWKESPTPQNIEMVA